jgi:glycosyltransferase involved in cell wall biosynthesis
MFSIIIPSFNREESLISLLKKLENQTYKKFEVVIVNDASTLKYNELKWIDSFNFPIKYFLNSKNTGPSGARNIGAKLASNDWLVFLDDDDLFINEKLDILANKISSGNYDFIYNKAIISMVNESVAYETSQSNISNITNPQEHIFNINFIGGAPNFSIKRKIFISKNGFNEELKAIEDYEFIIRILQDRKINIAFLNKALTHCYYTTQTNSVSKNTKNIDDAGQWIIHNYPQANTRKFKSNLQMMLAHSELMFLKRKSSYYYLRSFFYDPFSLKKLILSLISLISPKKLIQLRSIKTKDNC